MLKGVREGVPVCAEFSALSLDKCGKDRIDEGSSLLYTLELSNVAQSGLLPSGHPIGVVYAQSHPSFRHPFHCWVLKEQVPGPTAGGVGRLRTVVDHAANSAHPLMFRA